MIHKHNSFFFAIFGESFLLLQRIFSKNVCQFCFQMVYIMYIGVVEETPGRLEYEVALYKEAPPIGRINSNMAMSAHLKNQTKQQQAIINQNELPVDQAVPIGTKLQLRARISTQSVWKFVKLMEVTVSFCDLFVVICSFSPPTFLYFLSFFIIS